MCHHRLQHGVQLRKKWYYLSAFLIAEGSATQWRTKGRARVHALRPPPPPSTPHAQITFFSTPVLPPISNSRRLQFVKRRASGLNILIRGRYSFIYGYSLVTEEDRLTVRPTCLTSGILQTMARLFRESTFSFFLEVFLRIVQASHSGCHDRAVTLPSRRITPQNHTPHSGLARGGCPPPRFCGMRTPRSPHQTP